MAVPDPTFTVRVEFPVGVTVLGLKLPVAPVGSPLILKLTGELKPFREAKLTV